MRKPMFSRMTKGEIAFQAGNTVFLILLSVTMLYPFLHVVALSFSSPGMGASRSLLLIPEAFSLEAYLKVLQDKGIYTGFANSVGRTVIGTCLSLVFMSLGAYVIAKRSLPHRTFWTMLLVFTMFFSGGLIPTYLLIKSLGLIDSYLVYILPPLISTFSLIILRNFFMGISPEIEESARMDGANDLRILARIIVPMSTPIMATLALWHAVAHWNAWFDALIYIQTPWKQVMQLYLRRIVISNEALIMDRIMRGQDGNVNPDNLKAAVLVLTTLPIVAVYPFLQKYFTKGIMIGSIKG